MVFIANAISYLLAAPSLQASDQSSARLTLTGVMGIGDHYMVTIQWSETGAYRSVWVGQILSSGETIEHFDPETELLRVSHGGSISYVGFPTSTSVGVEAGFAAMIKQAVEKQELSPATISAFESLAARDRASMIRGQTNMSTVQIEAIAERREVKAAQSVGRREGARVTVMDLPTDSSENSGESAQRELVRDRQIGNADERRGDEGRKSEIAVNRVNRVTNETPVNVAEYFKQN